MSSFALALGSGGARGYAHIHAIKAFDDLGVRPTKVSGTSIGAIIGAAYCAGMSGAEIEDFVLSKVSRPVELLRDLFKSRPASMRSFFYEGGFRVGELNLERILATLLADVIPDEFEQLSVPLSVCATDYYDEVTVIFENGPLFPAMAASAAMPAVFRTVEREGRFFFDGSATNPCPLDVLQDAADHVVAIDVSGGSHGDPTIRPGKIDALYASSQIMQQSIVRASAAEFPRSIVLRPPVGRIRSLDFLKAKDVLDQTSKLHADVKEQLERLLN